MGNLWGYSGGRAVLDTLLDSTCAAVSIGRTSGGQQKQYLDSLRRGPCHDEVHKTGGGMRVGRHVSPRSVQAKAEDRFEDRPHGKSLEAG